MSLTENDIYAKVQSIFAHGLVIIVGSGASCALGLPGMTQLAEHLQGAIPSRIATEFPSSLTQWELIAKQLGNQVGLEEALTGLEVPDQLANLISEEIANCMLNAEERAIAAILKDRGDSSFGKLFSHILRTAPSVDVVTTNYDRLLEAHAARAGIRVDSMFYGHTIGRFDPEQSRKEMFRAETQPGKRKEITLRSWPHIKLSKPHGSLDWFTYNDQHFRSDLNVFGTRRIVAPGGNKYRLGYNIPFDEQRQRANAAIDNASALLFIGYGFNDDHLQTHVREKIRRVPSLTLSRTLTENAKEYLAHSSFSIGIEAVQDGNKSSRVVTQSGETILDHPIWDLDHLVKEVLGK